MVRQHVNPLSRFHQQPRPLPSLQELFADPDRPLHLDIGSARGRFLLALAPLEPHWNFLGVEIRRSLVEAAEVERRDAGLASLRFVFSNANVSLETWLAGLPPGRLQRVTIQFPDPWFKKKHHKRRVLQPALLRALATALPPGGTFFLQSDVTAVIEPMVALVEASGCFDRPAGDPRPWLPTSPLPVPTERERHVLAQGMPVFRVLYRRNGQAPPALDQLEEAAERERRRLEAADNPGAVPAAGAAIPGGT